MYEEPPTTFEEMMHPFSTEVQETAHWLRTLIRESFPQVTETIYGGSKVANALYSIDDPNAVALGIQGGGSFVKLFVHDPHLLGKPSFKLEGKGKHSRHIKFTEPPVDRREELVELMRIPVERRTK